MIGASLVPIAVSKNLTVTEKFAYGEIEGFQVYLYSEANYNCLCFLTRFPLIEHYNECRRELTAKENTKQYKITGVRFDAISVRVLFRGGEDLESRMNEYLHFVLPQLRMHGATGADICLHCGQPMTEKIWVEAMGVPMCVHPECAQKMRDTVGQRKNPLNGKRTSIPMGLLGAALGMILGAVVWGIVYAMGFVTGILGLLLGFLTVKGYDLLNGRPGTIKVVAMVISVIVGVAMGTFLGLGFTLYFDPEFSGITVPEVIEVLKYSLGVAEVQSAILRDYVMGVVFAMLGAITPIVQAKKNAGNMSVKDL